MSKNTFFLLFASLLICFMGFYNGFPLVFSDTGTYIHSGFRNEVPIDRPIMYGLFLRHISLSESLWLVIFAQGLILTTMIFYCFKYFSTAKNFLPFFIGYIITLVIFTGASVNVSQLIPDIFTPVIILAFILLVFVEVKTRFDSIVIVILALLAIMTHSSHFAIIGLFMVLISSRFLYQKFRKRESIISVRKLSIGWSLLIGSWLFLSTLHYSMGGGFSITRGSHVFMMSRLHEMGLLKDYLDCKCEKEKPYKLCEYKDQIPWDFIWDPNSPLNRTGGWIENKTEYKTIISDMLTTPKYLKKYILRCIESTGKQFFTFDVGNTPVMLDGSSPMMSMDWFFKSQIMEYVGAKQNNNLLNYDVINFWQKIYFILFLVISLFMLFSKEVPLQLKHLILLILGFMLINAFVCGSLSSISSRYQSRVVWLIGLPVFIALVNKGLLKRVFQSYISEK